MAPYKVYVRQSTPSTPSAPLALLEKTTIPISEFKLRKKMAINVYRLPDGERILLVGIVDTSWDTRGWRPCLIGDPPLFDDDLKRQHPGIQWEARLDWFFDSKRILSNRGRIDWGMPSDFLDRLRDTLRVVVPEEHTCFNDLGSTEVWKQMTAPPVYEDSERTLSTR